MPYIEEEEEESGGWVHRNAGILTQEVASVLAGFNNSSGTNNNNNHDNDTYPRSDASMDELLGTGVFFLDSPSKNETDTSRRVSTSPQQPANQQQHLHQRRLCQHEGVVNNGLLQNQQEENHLQPP